MITTFLQGGLANYLFEIAVAETIAMDNQGEAVFNLRNTVKVHNDITSYRDNILRNIKFNETDLGYKRYHEPEFNYNKIPFVDNVELVGYFQSEKYFKHRRKEILELFSPPDNIDTNLIKSNSCSIHIRRGDYLTLEEHYPSCSMDHYEKAMAEFPSDTIFYVFSDDIKWCIKNFKGDNFVFSNDRKDYEDLYYMSLCDHNIIANSSFSWWGAWLNDNPNKKVIVPKKWFGPAKANLDTKDIIPEEWIKI